MNIESRRMPVPPTILADRLRHRRRRHFLAWLLERCIAVPRAGTTEYCASMRRR